MGVAIRSADTHASVSKKPPSTASRIFGIVASLYSGDHDARTGIEDSRPADCSGRSRAGVPLACDGDPSPQPRRRARPTGAGDAVDRRDQRSPRGGLAEKRPRRSAPARGIREQSARGPDAGRRGGPADRLRRHVSGRRRVESQRGRAHRRRVQRDGIYRGGRRQPRFRFRVGRLAGGAAVAGRPARRPQGARRPGAISLPRGEPD